MVLQLIFKTAEELSMYKDKSEMTEEQFQDLKNKFLNYRSIYNLRYINLLQEINERQMDFTVNLKKKFV